ncbi:MAG TPA: beta-galactosidase [Bryobacteraceae bacterium]|nr:beta-galactosidase [Bryobacteraceae bacterium]
MRVLTTVLLAASLACAAVPDFYPVGVWYGGGKARAPMLERNPRSKKEAWRKDLRQIRALGFNTVRAWIDWASGEPAPGQYDFSTIDVILELAEQEHLKVLVQVYMDSAPRWVGDKYPDSLFVSSNGQAVKPESSPGYCRDHPGVRAADDGFYTALAKHASRSPAFIGFDLWSEPHVINWADPTYIYNPEFCFCRNTVARFRRWLQKKYGTLDNLNAAWYRRFASWEQVEPGRMSTILSYTDYIDWKTFIADKLGEDLRDRYQAVKSAAPGVLAMSHAAGVGLFSSPLWWEGQSDDWDMASQIDYYGTSFYPKHSAFVDRDVYWRAALLDFTRSFAYDGGRNGFQIGELQGGFGTIALNVSPTVSPEDTRLWTWSAIARGAKGIFYYAWYPMSSGYESGGYGLNQLDGTITDRAKVAGGIAAVVDRNQEVFLHARPPRAEVAIVYNPLVYFVGGRQRDTEYGGPQGEVAGIERDSLLGLHRALFPLNVPVDYVHIEHLDNLKQYKLVYVPYPPMLPESAAPRLREYVENGGVLVAEARLGWNNERGYASERIPGMGLAEVMGCRESAVQTGAHGRTELHWDDTAIGGALVLPARWYEETLQPLRPDARVVARFADGRPAAVASIFGKGRTVMLGSYVSAAYQTGPTDAVARFYGALLDWAGVTRPVVVEGGQLEAHWLESNDSLLLFALNHGDTAVDATVTLRPAAHASGALDLVTGEALKVNGGAVRLHVRARDVRVLRISTGATQSLPAPAG